MKAPSLEERVYSALEGARLMVNGLSAYIDLLGDLEEGQYVDSPFFDIIIDSISDENEAFGSRDNSELYTNTAYLRGMLDVYEKYVKYLSQLCGE